MFFILNFQIYFFEKGDIQGYKFLLVDVFWNFSMYLYEKQVMWIFFVIFLVYFYLVDLDLYFWYNEVQGYYSLLLDVFGGFN